MIKYFYVSRIITDTVYKYTFLNKDTSDMYSPFCQPEWRSAVRTIKSSTPDLKPVCIYTNTNKDKVTLKVLKVQLPSGFCLPVKWSHDSFVGAGKRFELCYTVNACILLWC